MVRAAIGKIVAIDAGDHHVAQLHLRRHARDVGGFGRVEAHVVLARIAFRHRAEAAAARAAGCPRIMNVAAPRWKHSWILGQRADSQTVWRLMRAEPGFQRVQRFEMGGWPRAPTQAGAGVAVGSVPAAGSNPMVQGGAALPPDHPNHITSLFVTLTPVDYFILVLYFAFVLGIGWRLRKSRHLRRANSSLPATPSPSGSPAWLSSPPTSARRK